jgi:hypothetical protein
MNTAITIFHINWKADLLVQTVGVIGEAPEYAKIRTATWLTN